MRARCEASSGASLTAEYLRAGYTQRSAFGVSEPTVYQVHGMCLQRSILCYLVKNDRAEPEWIPALAFEVVDDSLPADWFFDFNPNPGLVEAVWGYEQLVREPGYFDRLSRREAGAVEVFRNRSDQL